MAKLTKSQIERLGALGITEKDEASAKKAVLKHLENNDITEVDDELLDDLIEMAEAFPLEETEETEETSEEELDEASEELEETNDEEEEEMPAPKKPAGKSASKAAPAAKAPAKKAAKKETAKKSKRIDPAKSAKDRVHYDFLSEKMPNGEKFEYNWLSGGGLAVKHVGKNAKKSLISFEPSLQEDGTLVGNLIFNIWKKNIKRLKEIIGADYDVAQTWSGNPYVAGASSKDYLKILSKKDFMKEMLAMVEKGDEKLGKNRDKMEDNLKKGSAKAKPAVKAPAAKAPAPVKKAAAPAKKAAPAKAPAKKK